MVAGVKRFMSVLGSLVLNVREGPGLNVVESPGLGAYTPPGAQGVRMQRFTKG